MHRVAHREVLRIVRKHGLYLYLRTVCVKSMHPAAYNRQCLGDHEVILALHDPVPSVRKRVYGLLADVANPREVCQKADQSI